jgi:hypothetical protein
MSRPLDPPLGDPRLTGVWERSAPAPNPDIKSSRKSRNAPAIEGGAASSDGSWDTWGGTGVVTISSETFFVDPRTNAQNCHPFLEDPSVDTDIHGRIADIRFRSFLLFFALDHLKSIGFYRLNVGFLSFECCSLKNSIRELKPAEEKVVEEEEEEDEDAEALRQEQERRSKVKPKFKEGNTVLFRYRVLRDGQPTALRVYGQVSA